MRKIIVTFLTVVLLLSLSISSAQDTSKVGVTADLQWEYELVKDTEGTFGITNSDDGAVAVGETYTFTITSLEDNGGYDFEYSNGETTGAGSDSLGDFGADPNAVYTDWQYWGENIDDTDTFSGLTGTNTTTEGNVFTADWSAAGITLHVEYFMDTGVLKNTYLNDGEGMELEIENVTGSAGEEVPGFQLLIGLTSVFFATLLIKRTRKN